MENLVEQVKQILLQDLATQLKRGDDDLQEAQKSVELLATCLASMGKAVTIAIVALQKHGDQEALDKIKAELLSSCPSDIL